MTRYTAVVIQNQNNDIHCESYGQCKDTGKWAGAINLYHNGHFHTTLLSSNKVFDSSVIAISEMESVVERIRALNLSL